MSIVDIIVEIFELALIGGLAWDHFRNRQYANRRIAAFREAFERLYDKTNRRLSEHIGSRMH